jgi:hypothetical protein
MDYFGFVCLPAEGFPSNYSFVISTSDATHYGFYNIFLARLSLFSTELPLGMCDRRLPI